MKLISLILPICIFFSIFRANAESQYDFPTRSSACSAVFNPNNPSMYRFNQKSEIGMYVMPSRFGLQELTYGGIYTVLPIRDGTMIGSKISGQSFDLYSRLTGSLALANEFGEMLTFLVGVDLERTSYKGFGNFSRAELNTSAILRFSPSIKMGLMLGNLLNAQYDEQKKNKGQKVVIGFAYKPNEKFAFDISSNIFVRDKTFYCASLSYQIHERILTTIDASPNPANLNLIMDCRVDSTIYLAPSIYFQQYLGWSFAFGLRLFL